MGAWGTGIFENDDALGWLYELATVGSVVITGAMTDVQDGSKTGYIEVDIGARGLAACEIVAASRGFGPNPRPDLSSVVQVDVFWPWVTEQLQAERKHAKDCIAVVEAIVQDPDKSELLGLWSEGGDTARRNEFLEIAGGLLDRLEKAAK
jgi:hypothetical protein